VEHIYPLPGEEDERTPEEEARDLGILPDMPDMLIITNVKWICNEQGRSGDHDVRVGSCGILARGKYELRRYKDFLVAVPVNSNG
jgi:hypothetical protein